MLESERVSAARRAFRSEALYTAVSSVHRHFLKAVECDSGWTFKITSILEPECKSLKAIFSSSAKSPEGAKRIGRYTASTSHGISGPDPSDVK